MSDKVSGGRGHKISPAGKPPSKIAYGYAPCPKIDPDHPDNFMSLGMLPTPNGNLNIIFSHPKLKLKTQSIALNFLSEKNPSLQMFFVPFENEICFFFVKITIDFSLFVPKHKNHSHQVLVSVTCRHRQQKNCKLLP
jgi:hypothetical protein